MMMIMIIMCFLYSKGPQTGLAPGGGSINYDGDIDDDDFDDNDNNDDDDDEDDFSFAFGYRKIMITFTTSGTLRNILKNNSSKIFSKHNLLFSTITIM